MREWQVLQIALARWRSICSRVVKVRPLLSGAVFNGGTPAGGGWGGESSRLVSTHLPRRIGEVLLVCEVTIRIEPIPVTQPRGLSAGNATRRKPGPLPPGP